LKADWTVREQNMLAIYKLNMQGAARIDSLEFLLSKAVTADHYAHAIEVLLYDTPMVRLYPDFKDHLTISIIWEARERTKSKENLGDYFELLQDLGGPKGQTVDHA
jgi:hypothetical protein